MNKTILTVQPARYFLLAFGLSWLIWIPLDLSHFGIGPLYIPEGISAGVRLLGVLMPAAAGWILTSRQGGRAASRALFGRLALWRVGWKWWAAAALVQPAMLVFTGLAFNLWGGKPAITSIPLVSAVGFLVNIFFLLLATLGEEIGWRGVALPALQARRGALVSSAILGVLWTVWHIPFWLLLDTFGQYGILYLGMNFLLVFPMTFYITWIFNHTNTSLLMPVLSHVTFNIVNTALLPVTTNIQAFGLFIAVEWVLAALIIRRLDPEKQPDITHQTKFIFR